MKMTTIWFQKHKEKIQKEASEWYQNLSDEEKDKRRKKAWERHQNLTKGETKGVIRIFLRKLTEYKRNYYLTNKR